MASSHLPYTLRMSTPKKTGRGKREIAANYRIYDYSTSPAQAVSMMAWYITPSVQRIIVTKLRDGLLLIHVKIRLQATIETNITNLALQVTRDLLHSESIVHVRTPTPLQQSPKRVIQASFYSDWVRGSRWSFALTDLKDDLSCEANRRPRFFMSHKLEHGHTEGIDVGRHCTFASAPAQLSRTPSQRLLVKSAAIADVEVAHNLLLEPCETEVGKQWPAIWADGDVDPFDIAVNNRHAVQ